MFLINTRSGTLKIADEFWIRILKLARGYGWKPQGTLPNRDYLKKRARKPEGGYDEEMVLQEVENWKGDYIKNEHQIVTWADALNIAFALEDAVIQSSKMNVESIKEFINFCKRGSFFLG